MAISIKVDSRREFQYKSQALSLRTKSYLVLRNGKVSSVTGGEWMKGKMVGEEPNQKRGTEI